MDFAEARLRKICITPRTTRSICVAAALVGCASARHGVILAPLEDEGELFVALRPATPEMRGVTLAVESAAVISADGVMVPLALRQGILSLDGERLLGSARLPAGTYGGISL